MKDDQLPVDAKINGGIEIPVTLKNGTTENVLVLIVPLSKASKYVELESELTRFVELVTKKPEGWADTLEDDSVYEIDELAHRLNDPRIDRFLKRQMKTVERMAPMARMMQEKAAGLTNS